MNCPRCQRPLREGVRFCTVCGLSTAEMNKRADTDEALRQETVEDPRPPDDYTGRVLDGKYELVARLGVGGMGTVYRARRLHIGDEVAVKVLNPKYVADADAVERFRREARSAAMIRHANVVTIHDFGEARTKGAPAYLVMELVRGATLRELLRREGRLAPARAVELMRDVCAGVGVAHRESVVHRDLKPDNVIVVPPAVEGERETAKVVDFGLAKLRELRPGPSLTETGAVMGTPFYMSPEQCRGEELDARADVYSLGAMLYEMLAGAPPFVSNSLAGLISKHLHEEPPALPAGSAPPALEAVCRRALAKNPDERPSDANAFSRELRAALDDTPSLATVARGAAAVSERARSAAPTLPHPDAARGRKKKSRGLKLVAVGLVALLACALAAAVALRHFGGDKRASSATDTNAAGVSVTPSPREVGATPAVEEEESAPEESTPTTNGGGLSGRWAGTYGPLGQPATLTIKEDGGKFGGVLEQGAVRVAFTGSFDASTRKVTMKETRLLSGDGWSLGENTGTVSADGRTMSGTGSDPVGAQLGVTYSWSFTKR